MLSVKKVEPKNAVWIIIFIISSLYLISYFCISSNDPNRTKKWRLRVSEKEKYGYGTVVGGREKRWRIVRPVMQDADLKRLSWLCAWGQERSRLMFRTAVQ